MSAPPESSSEETAASLMAGIFLDVQTLCEQRLKLMQLEIEEEVRQRARATLAFALGMSSLFIASIMFSFGLVHLLNWLASSPERSAELTNLWLCHVAVGAILTVLGTGLTWLGMHLFRSPVALTE